MRHCAVLGGTVVILMSLTKLSFGAGNLMNIIASFEGRYFPSIILATNEFRKTGLNLDNYRITLIEEGGDLLLIGFSWKDKPQGLRGSPKEFPGFEVEVDVQANQVKRKNFSR